MRKQKERHHGTRHHHSCHGKTVDKHAKLGIFYVPDVGLAIIIVADDAAEGKEPYHHSHKVCFMTKGVKFNNFC